MRQKHPTNPPPSQLAQSRQTSVDGQLLLAQKRAEYAQSKGAKKARGEGAFSLLTARLEAQSVAETDSAEMAIKSAVKSDPPTPKPTKTVQTIRVYPSLVTAWLREGEESAGRAWLLLRHLDPQGRGWLDGETVRDQLTNKTSQYRLCGQRRLRQILKDGDGRFWKLDREKRRIWLQGAGAVAKAFKVDRLRGHNVTMPLKKLLNGMATVRAYFYASFHAGRKTAPITRTTLETITGISERSQRRYDQLSGVLREKNISIEEKRTKESAESHAWTHGQASFVFYDRQGRQGKPHTLYNARRLPNSYHSPLERGTDGRRRRINRKLDLVTKGAQGNEPQESRRLFIIPPRQYRPRQGMYIRYGEYKNVRSRERIAFWATVQGGI